MLTLVLATVLLAWAGGARALDPVHKITQYGHRIWRVGEAGLDSEPTSIAQTSDGQIWVGTTNGLYRFDGKQFTRGQPATGAPMISDLVENLFGARNGDLYVGARNGLFRVSHGGYFRYPMALDTPGPFAEDKHGTVWAGIFRSSSPVGACSIGSTTLHCYGPRDGLPCLQNESMDVDREGGVWLGGIAGICHWRPGWQNRTYPLGDTEAPATQLAFDTRSILWASVAHGGAKSGLWFFNKNTWKRFSAPSFDSRHLNIYTLFSDHQGALWLGGSSHGLYRIVDGQVSHFDRMDGLSGDYIKYFSEDHEGSIWVATNRGVEQFFDRPIISFGIQEGLASNEAFRIVALPGDGVVVDENSAIDRISEDGHISPVTKIAGEAGGGAVFADSAGRIWYVVHGKIRVRDGRRTRTLALGGARSPRVDAIAEDARHAIWIAGHETTNPPHAWLWRIDREGQVRRMPSPPNGGATRVSDMASDLAGGLWVATTHGGLYHWRGDTFTRVSDLDALAEAGLRQVQPVAPQEAWIATRAGAAWLKAGRVRVLGVADGLPCGDVHGVASDLSGGLWVTTQCALVEITPVEIDRWRREPGYRVHAVVFGPSSGYLGDEKSQLVRSAGGKLWFAGGDEAHEIDPAHIPINSVAPPVQVQGVEADQRPYAVGPRVELPKLTRNLEIDYAALSYLQPELLTFRYRLFGHDQEWINAGARRQAFYTDLEPGAYRFQVTACNKDGVCNREGASLAVVIPPAWWQTWLFLGLCVLAALAAIVLTLRWRLRARDEAMRLRFNDRLDERTRVARDLHDTLMQTVLASKLLAESGRTFSTVPEGRALLGRLSGWLGDAADEGRAAVQSLRSSTVESNHLAEAFEMACDEAAVARELETRILVTGAVRELHPLAREEVHRIGVEAIRNAASHSEASLLEVLLEYSQGLVLRVRDNGKGIDADVLEEGRAGHFGLRGMRERADHIGAKLAITSSSAGTEIVLTVPGTMAFAGRSGFSRLLPKIKL